MTDNQSEDQNKAPVVDEVSEKSLLEGFSLFLNTAEPARLLMWSALAILLAAVCTYFGIQMQFGMSDSSMLGLWQTGEHASMDPYGRETPFPPILGKVLTSFGFVFGIVGTLLPMWAVGRLIADAIKAGDNHE